MQSHCLWPDINTCKHHFHSNHNELWQISGHLFSTTKHRGCEASEEDDRRIMDSGLHFCYTTDIYFRASMLHIVFHIFVTRVITKIVRIIKRNILHGNYIERMHISYFQELCLSSYNCVDVSKIYYLFVIYLCSATYDTYWLFYFLHLP